MENEKLKELLQQINTLDYYELSLIKEHVWNRFYKMQNEMAFNLKELLKG